MIEIALGLIGFGAGVFMFAVGLVLGIASRKSDAQKWIDEFGCYSCQEKFKHRHLP